MAETKRTNMREVILTFATEQVPVLITAGTGRHGMTVLSPRWGWQLLSPGQHNPAMITTPPHDDDQQNPGPLLALPRCQT